MTEQKLGTRGGPFRELHSSGINEETKEFCKTAILQGVQREGRKKQEQAIQNLIATKYGSTTIVTRSKGSIQRAQGASWCYSVQYGSCIYNVNSFHKQEKHDQ